jgi:hypothetical protein
MTSRTIVLAAGLGLSAALVPLTGGAEDTAAARRPPIRVYTNEDLDRVRPYRDETGVRSVPAFSGSERPSATRAGDDRPRPRGEAYWREQARRVRERISALDEKADELRARIAAAEEERRHVARSSGGSRGRGSSSAFSDPSAKARLASIEKRMRALEDDLADRARRDNALPGWLR